MKTLSELGLGPYSMEPAPRTNPEGRLDLAWVVRASGKIVKRFDFDGRDKAEEWIYRRRLLAEAERANDIYLARKDPF